MIARLSVVMFACLAMPLLAEPPPPKPLDHNAPDYMKCRRLPITGSLVRKEKVCKTNAEWARIDGNGNRSARILFESGGVCAGGPGCSGPS